MLLTLALAVRPPCSWGWGARSWAQSGTSGVLTCAEASPCRLGRGERWETWDDGIITDNMTLWILWAASDILHQGFITKLIGKRRRKTHQTKNPSKVSIPSYTECLHLETDELCSDSGVRPVDCDTSYSLPLCACQPVYCVTPACHHRGRTWAGDMSNGFLVWVKTDSERHKTLHSDVTISCPAPQIVTYLNSPVTIPRPRQRMRSPDMAPGPVTSLIITSWRPRIGREPRYWPLIGQRLVTITQSADMSLTARGGMHFLLWQEYWVTKFTLCSSPQSVSWLDNEFPRIVPI